jgi:hypothetical protein
MAEIFRNQWWLVTHEQGEPFARLVRSGVAFSDLEAAARVTIELLPSLGQFTRLLVDFRGGPPGRNDSAFEEASGEWRRALARSFERRAIVVKSAAGRLQVKRLNTGASEELLVTQSEDEAIRFLSNS